MINEPSKHVDECIAAGADILTIHYESDLHPIRTLDYIKSKGIKAGIAINPATSEVVLESLLDYCDLILVMLVNPGFGGQSFIPQTLDKLKQVRERIDASGRDIRLEIDGGVKVDNIAEIAAAGADMFVAGSAIFNQPDYAQVITQMREELAKVSR